MRQLAAAAGDGPLGFAGSPGQLETSLNSGYTVGPCNSYLEGPTLILFGLAARAIALGIRRRRRRSQRKNASALSSLRTAARDLPTLAAHVTAPCPRPCALPAGARSPRSRSLSPAARPTCRRSQPCGRSRPAAFAETWVNPAFRRSANVATCADRQKPMYT